MDDIMEYIKYLEGLIPEKDSLKIVKTEAEKFIKRILLMNVSTWDTSCISLITFRYKK